MKAIKPLAVVMTALVLQGCVAAAVVGTAAVGTKAATDPRSVGTQVDDGTLELRVNTALGKDQQLKKEARINVTAYSGQSAADRSVAEPGTGIPRETNRDGRGRCDGSV